MYLPYEPISKKPDSSAFIPPELWEAQKQAKCFLPAKLLKEWDSWVAKQVGFTQEQLWLMFSSEQIDSIGLSIYNFELGKNFIIADETGIGKGRILSGICRWAILHEKKILFFTEREHLFSDFWRDLIDTDTISLLKNPIVFHSSSKVFDNNNEVVLKGNIKSTKFIQDHGFSDDTNLVMTNYSQISLKQHKKNKKDNLIEYCKDNIIILDECHNATGDSNTKKFLLSLCDESKHIVFSSATFMKDETQLELYEKTMDFDIETIHLFKKLLSNDQELILRKIFTYELTRRLQFWRREHQPLNIGWKSIVCQNSNQQEEYVDKYSNIVNGLFQLSNSLSKEPSLQHLNLNNSWFALGATINRLSRNLLLLLKVDTLIEEVKKSLLRNHKSVVVIDSTFASIINKIITHQTIDDDDEIENIEIEENNEINYELNFKQILFYIIEEVAGKHIKQYESQISEKLKNDYKDLNSQAISFENLNISPIDMIINQLASEGISCSEISGRTFRINSLGKIEKIIKQPKSKIVSEYNNNTDKNVIIITRAGASGISLHSSATFKDQRIRDLFELEITNRPTYRLQFIGRVNRKNQVFQPEFYTIITKLPFEQRILNIEQQKLKTLQSHISGDDEKLDQENIYNFYTKYCNQSVYQFLQNNKYLAFQMGIAMKDKLDEFYYIDSILKRCIVLNSEQQNFLYDYLIYCTECERKLQIKKVMPNSIQMINVKTFWHELDSQQQTEFSKNFGQLPQLSINQFKYPWVGLMKTVSVYSTNSIFSLNLKNELENNLLNQKEIGDYLNKSLEHYHIINSYNINYINTHIKPIINGIKLGTCINIKTIEGNIFGYIHNITYPKINKNYQYDNLTLIHIKTINPHLHNSIFYAPVDYYITLKELVESENINLYSNPIDWSKFNRPTKEYERTNYCLIGHPIYMEFLRQSYRIGEIRYFQVAGKKNMCILLPNSLTEPELFKLKKPIYQANKIMEGLICKKINRITTVWEDENIVKPTLKIEPTTGGYNLFIASEIARNPEIIDYPLKQKLKNKKGFFKGFELYMVPYKEIRVILLMFEKRDVVWFIN